MKKIWAIVILVIVAAVAVVLLKQKNKIVYQPQQQATSTPVTLSDGRLRVDSPKVGDTVGQSFGVSGYAQNWFEGNIAIKVYDDNNRLLYQGIAIASDNYDHPAPFSSVVTLSATPTATNGHLEFNDYSAKDGSLIYQKVVNIKFSFSK